MLVILICSRIHEDIIDEDDKILIQVLLKDAIYQIHKDRWRIANPNGVKTNS